MLNPRILFAISIVLLIYAFFSEGKYKILYILSSYMLVLVSSKSGKNQSRGTSFSSSPQQVGVNTPKSGSRRRIITSVVKTAKKLFNKIGSLS